MGAVFSAFALGYALAQIPAGWLVDRVGPRLMLGGVVSLWSALTALTGTVSSLGVMLAVRFWFGVFEAGAFPASARVFYNWLPSSERGRANGIIFSGSRLGAALAFPLMAWLSPTGTGVLPFTCWRYRAWPGRWAGRFGSGMSRPIPPGAKTRRAGPNSRLHRCSGHESCCWQ